MPNIGVYPGTFDPITLGHKDIIRRAALIVDTLIVGVAADSSKTPLFTLEERTALVAKEIANISGNIIVASFEGLLVNFAKAHNASLIIRGLRAVSDFEYEFQMSAMNNKLSPEIQTIFLPASEGSHFIASRIVKEICRLGGDISQFVSPHVKDSLDGHFSSV